MRSRGQNGQVQLQGSRWTLRYWADAPEGRTRKRETLGEVSRMTKAEALKAARALLVAMDAQMIHPTKRITLGEFWTDVFEVDYVTSKKASGQKHYKYVWGSHASELKDLVLIDIKAEHVQALCKRKLSSGLSGQTVRHIKNCLGAMFRYAIERDYLNSKNPCTAVRLPELVKTRESKALSFVEASKLVEEMKVSYSHPGWIMVWLGITTSMNVSELRGLKWGKVNLSEIEFKNVGSAVLPPSSMLLDEQNYRGAIGTVKTSNRARIVPIGVQARSGLCEFKQKKAELIQTLDSMAVFTSKSGKVYDERNMLEDIKVIGRKLGFGWVNWHSFRHTYNTLASQGSMSVIDRMAGSGHGNMRMSLLYSHSEIERRRVGIEEIERGLSNG